MSLFPIKLVLLLFWCLWFSLVLLTNLIAGLQVLGLVSKDRKLASDNYELIEKATSVYRLPAWLNRLLFGGVILWQTVIAVLFWRLLILTWSAGWIDLSNLIPPFAAGLGLFAVFMLSDELFHYYQGERSHLEIFTGLLVTLLVVVLLP